jgi:LacI family transcriptional regulator
VARILDRDPTVTAIFGHNDEMATGILRQLADRNIAVPDRVSVIGCDDLPLSRFLSPTLTTIHVPFTETGARAADVLLALIGGQEVPDRELLPVHLVQRASTGPPPREHGVARARGAPRSQNATTTRRRRSKTADLVPPTHNPKEPSL